MVTAPHVLASQIGARAIADGGSAADAAVAVGAALAVVYPHMTGIGGDAFWLYHDAASGATTAYNGSGAAAALANAEFYRRLGMSSIPARGPVAALTVPGAVDAWFAIHERFGKLELTRLLQPAIACARDGVPTAPSVARSLMEERKWLACDDGARATYLSARSTLVQPALAKTLEMIAAEGRSWFYEGPAAAAIAAWAERAGSPLREKDFAEHHGFVADPAAGSFAGFDSLVTPPNSQGVTLIAAQQIFETFVGSNVPSEGSAETLHAAIESAKLAYADRDRLVGDPGALPPPAEFISRGYAARQAARIRWERAIPATSAASESGTTYFACVDPDGNAVSYIQSLYHHFGAAVVVPALGIALQNRGIAFTLDEEGVRSLVPGRRPFHTLMAAMLSSGGKPKVVYGSMGGDAQPQIALGLSIRIALHGRDPQPAVEAPRWRWFNSDGIGQGRVAVERRVGDACLRGLRERGHALDVLGDWEESMGHAGAIVIDRKNGKLLGGADPRGDGAAVGI